jgi:hypothetical protein
VLRCRSSWSRCTPSTTARRWLAVRPDGTGGVLDCYQDTPPAEHAYADIEDLLAQTVVGLRGEHSRYRCALTGDYLLWVDREFDDQGADVG